MERAALAGHADLQRALAGSREVVFVLDCADAMAGAPLLAAKAVCRQLVEGLQAWQRFTIVAFGSGALLLDECLHAAGEGTKALAGDFLDLLDVMGGHALHHALARALSCLKGPAPAIVVIGDGGGNPLPAIVRQAREAAVVVHGLDYAVAASPLADLCAATGGYRVRLPKADNTEARAALERPKRYFCHQSILCRRGRVLPEWHPQRLAELLATSGDDRERLLPRQLAATLADLLRNGCDRLEIEDLLQRVIRDLAAIGGGAGQESLAAPPQACPEVYLALRVAVMRLCRKWCQQEVICNPSHGREAVPEFLLRNPQGPKTSDFPAR